MSYVECCSRCVQYNTFCSRPEFLLPLISHSVTIMRKVIMAWALQFSICCDEIMARRNKLIMKIYSPHMVVQYNDHCETTTLILTLFLPVVQSANPHFTRSLRFCCQAASEEPTKRLESGRRKVERCGAGTGKGTWVGNIIIANILLRQ